MPGCIDSEEERAVSAYLTLLAKDMTEHPERISALTEEEVGRLRRLTAGVAVSCNDIVPDDVML
jgi:hypothetical protein